MSPAFDKWHIDRPGVLHLFSAPDNGDPHDHPWGFRTTILYGGYTEQIFSVGGFREFVDRKPGDVIDIPATHIHRIVTLPMGYCLTFIEPGPWERKSRFWQFRDDGAWSRAWDDVEWTRHG